MKHFTFDNHWDAIKARLKQRYTQFTDDDLAFAEGKGEELIARLREKAGASAEDFSALLGELYDKAAGKWEQVKTKAGELAEEAGTRTAEAYDHARESLGGMCECGDDFVRQHPRKSLLAAICVGLVAGMLIRRS